jgi:hypothetical protein
MAPSRVRTPAAGKVKISGRTTKNGTKTITKPIDENRVSKPEAGKASYNDKAVATRKAKDAHIMDKPNADSKRQERLLARGPHGRPIYDTQGFELDYSKVLKSRKPISKSSRGGKNYMKMIEKDQADNREIERIMGLPDHKFSGASVRAAVQDRVARDLDVPWHTVDISHYRRWRELGFKAHPEDFKLENISEEERERLMELACGSALRK